MTEEILRFDLKITIPEFPIGTKLYIADQLVEIQEYKNCEDCVFNLSGECPCFGFKQTEIQYTPIKEMEI